MRKNFPRSPFRADKAKPLVGFPAGDFSSLTHFVFSGGVAVAMISTPLLHAVKQYRLCVMSKYARQKLSIFKDSALIKSKALN
jgi:hypothetical protein